jgi:type I restriction enzyme S subunit
MKWRTATLEQIATITGGSTPSRSREGYWNGSIFWLTPTDLPMPGQGIAEVTDTASKITEEGLAAISAQLLPPGTVLFSSRATIGKLGISRVPLATNQGFANFIPKKVVDAKYLAYCLLHFTNDITALAGSTTFKEVTKTALRRFRIPLPALSEQCRIVEILDQADALRRRRAEADNRVARILTALFYKMFGDPATNPKGWPTVQIRKLVKPVERRDPASQPDDAFTYIDIAGVDGKSGTIVEKKELLGADAPSRARQVIRKNDVIISTVRPYLRATALVPQHLNEQICSTGFCVLRTEDGFGFGFLYALSRLQWFTDQLNARARGASYPAVTDKDILDLNVPRPVMTRMHEAFDAQIHDALALQHKRNKAVVALETLFSSLLHRAFTGDLTAKWHEAHLKELLAEMEMQAKALNVRNEP